MSGFDDFFEVRDGAITQPAENFVAMNECIGYVKVLVVQVLGEAGWGPIGVCLDFEGGVMRQRDESSNVVREKYSQY